MRFGYWLPVFGGWLRNVPDEQMDATWAYVSRLARRSEEIGFDLTLVAESFPWFDPFRYEPVYFVAAAGATYQISADSFYQESGDIRLEIDARFFPTNDMFADRSVIENWAMGATVGATKEPGAAGGGGSDGTELRVDERRDLVKRAPVTGAPSVQEPGDIAGHPLDFTPERLSKISDRTLTASFQSADEPDRDQTSARQYEAHRFRNRGRL